MLPEQRQFKFRSSAPAGEGFSTSSALELIVTLDVPAGGFEFEWLHPASAEVVARGRLTPSPHPAFGLFDLDWELEADGKTETDHCNQWPASIRALLKRLRKTLPVAEDGLRICVEPDVDIGPATAGATHPARAPSAEAAWNWLAREIQRFAKAVQVIVEHFGRQGPQLPGPPAARFLAHGWLGVPLSAPAPQPGPAETAELTMRVTKDFVHACIVVEWSNFSTRAPVARGVVLCQGRSQLSWTLEADGQRETCYSTHSESDIHSTLNRWLARFPARRDTFRVFRRMPGFTSDKSSLVEEPGLAAGESPSDLLEEEVYQMAVQLSAGFPLLDKVLNEFEPEAYLDFEKYQRRLERKEQKRAEEEERRRETMARLAEERRRREQRAAQERKTAGARKAAGPKQTASAQPHLKSEVANLKWP